jgi:hypothetical protein
MRLRCWLDDPPSYTLELDEQTSLVLDCPAQLFDEDEDEDAPDQGQGVGSSSRRVSRRGTAWLAEAAHASAVLISDHSSCGALPALLGRASSGGGGLGSCSAPVFDGAVFLTEPTAKLAELLLPPSPAQPPTQRHSEGLCWRGRQHTLAYGERIDLAEHGAPGVWITAFSSGRCLGGAAWLIEYQRASAPAPAPAAATGGRGGAGALLYIGAGSVHQLSTLDTAELLGDTSGGGGGGGGAGAGAGGGSAPAGLPPLTFRRHARPMQLGAMRAALGARPPRQLTLVFGSRLRMDGGPSSSSSSSSSQFPFSAASARHSSGGGGGGGGCAVAESASADDAVGRGVRELLRLVGGALEQAQQQQGTTTTTTTGTATTTTGTAAAAAQQQGPQGPRPLLLPRPTLTVALGPTEPLLVS